MHSLSLNLPSLALAFALASWPFGASAAVSLVSATATWRYLDTGVPPATAWTTAAFDDTTWKLGPAQLGYGDNDEATVVGYGPNASSKYITTWFRQTFTVDEPAAFGSLTLQVLRDDGCVVYLNGQEVARYNLPAGTILPSTLAPTGSDYAWDPPVAIQNLLVPGVNVVAVEMHQSSATSSDLSLALQLDGERAAPTVALVQPAEGSIAHSTQVTFVVDAADATGLTGATLWLGQPTRSVTFTGPGRTVDTYLSADASSANYSSAASLTVDGQTPHAHALLRFLDLTGPRSDQLPAGVSISSARLRVYCSNASVTPLQGYALREDWVASEATWNQRQAGIAWANPGADGTASHGATVSAGDCTATGWRTLDVTALVQEWCSGAANYGFVFLDAGTDGIGLASVESATPPELVVEYGGSALVPVASQALGGSPSARLTFTLELGDLQAYLWNCEVTNTAGVTGRPTEDGLFSVDTHYPTAPVVVAPAQGAAPSPPEVTLQVAVSDPDADPSLAVTFYGRSLQADGEPFTVAVLPDTQKYVASATYAPIFTQQTQWIVEQRSAWGIVFVSHVGDVADTYNSTAQYDLARGSLGVLHNAGVPYGLLPGNHDQPTTLFNQYFSFSRYADKPWYGGHHPADKNDNSYQLFSAGGMDFLAVHLAFWPDAAAVQWADSVLKAYPDRIAMLSTHGYLNVDATRNVHIMGSTEYLWDQLVVPNPNVFFVFAGHVHGEARRSDSVNGRVIHQMLADYQDYTEGGQGWMRLLRFVPAEDRVYVSTWSPHLNLFQADADSEFTLDFPMSGFGVLGQTLNIPSRQTASFTWTGLAEGEFYEWYATVTDSTGRSTRGPLSNFSPSLTPDTTAPSLGNLVVAEITDHSARFSWTTDEAATSRVDYWVEPDGQPATRSDPALATLHELVLSGLQPDTGFQCQIRSADGAGNEALAEPVVFRTLPVNHPPIAANVEASTPEDIPVLVVLAGTDPDADPLGYTVLTHPQHGSLAGSGPDILYTPAPDFSGEDTFTYQVTDGTASSGAATVRLTVSPVNDRPQATALTLNTAEDTPVSVTLAGTDADGDPLTFVVIRPPQHGTLSGILPHLTYVPAPDANGEEVLWFVAHDGETSSDPALVTLLVTPVNDAPVADAGPDQTVEQDSAVTLDATASLDPDGPDLTYVWQQTSGPLVELTTADGAVPTFTSPVVELDTNLVFCVTVSDGQLTATDEVQITVENRAFDAVAAAEPTGSGTLVGGAFSNTHLRDGNSQSFAEAQIDDSHRLSLDYTLQCAATPGVVLGLTLRLAATFTDADELIRVLLWNGTDWEDATAGFNPDGSYSPATPAGYVIDGRIRVRLSDAGLNPDATADVLAIDELAAHVQATAPDTQAPLPPTGLSGAAVGRQVTLTWGANQEPDLAGYRVHRCVTGTGQFEDVSGLLEATTWIETLAADGTYDYALTAEDVSGNRSGLGSTVRVQVAQPASHVSSISLTVQKVSKKYQAISVVGVQNQLNAPMAGATVTGNWYFKGALIRSAATAKTDASGNARFTSPQVTGQAGNVFLFRVTGVTKTGYPYNPIANTITERSISVP